MTYYYGCFVTHYVHDLNLMKKGPNFMGGSLEALIIYSEVFEKDLEDMVDSFFF